MRSNIIFLGGIHGAGKGTICQELSNKHGVHHISASDLIKWTEISSKGNKNVKNILDTQKRLLLGLKQNTVHSKVYLLDGHFCLLDKDEIPRKIPFKTFKTISPKLIAIKTDRIEDIVNRLHKRDQKSYSPETLSRMQDMEYDYSKSIARQLNVPFVDISNGKENQLLKYL